MCNDHSADDHADGEQHENDHAGDLSARGSLKPPPYLLISGLLLLELHSTPRKFNKMTALGMEK
jgi:hypothetical protein